ncbi:MAG: alpha/beta fold hydrolase [Alphaproteobacteria bacterium]|nr:alpha/beta fold hydrolase [Alphaproteobacteria bacterium]MCZ6590014.1 alpha/beta fold hydrolase [Alphaproteobacteria bacterium]MCZ6839199.1 alpha/beta fold hydrolase [Alphaproteobacteria bacterium]MCZ6847027.1 alpha/beta fold hydrolase [Alphaproteobacteria bacterium]
MPIVNTGRFDINYIEDGDGYPVVLIHGLAGDHTAWLPQVTALKGDYRVIAFDNPGSGDSSTVDDPASTADLADATLGLMDQLGIERAHVIGRSMGGAIAQHMALKAPDRLQSMAMAASFARLDPIGAQIISNLQQLLGWRPNWAEWAPHAVFLFVAPAFYNDNPELIERITVLVSDEGRDMVSYDHLATACLEHDTLDRLGEIQTPTLVMGGRFDPICSMTAQNWMMDALPNAELEVFEASSHFFLMEEAEKTLTTMKEWLAKNTP